MKFRTGLLVGAAVGYYYGTKAGPERHAQLERIFDRVRASGPYGAVRDRAAGLADQGRERALDLVDGLTDRTGGLDAPSGHHTIGTQPVDPRDDTEPFELFSDPRLN